MEPIARFETLTRIGFAARGLTYLIVGYLAIEAGRATGTSGALRAMAESGTGRLALGVVAVGLLAYGAWRILEAAFDLEGSGTDAKGSVVRTGHGLSGIAHIFLGLLALGLATGMAGSGGGGEGESARSATSWLLDLPAGATIVRLVGVVLMAVGAYQAVQAIRLRFLRQLDARAASQAWVKWVGRLGYLARGAVFILIGSFFWRAGETANAQQAGGMGDAIGSLSGWMQVAVAAGLALFGLFSIVQAIYRRITDPHAVERLKARFA
jgi:hypothetical protein